MDQIKNITKSPKLLNFATIFLYAIFFTTFTLYSAKTWAQFENSINQEKQLALKYLLQNISRSDTPKGFVVASPTRNDPNYYYHWVRDAALVMQTLATIPTSNPTRIKLQDFSPIFNDYIQLEKEHQRISKLTDQGEPKFNPNGTAYDGPWGRPQNDGPALRSTFMINMAEELLSSGKKREALMLYSPVLPANTPVKIDLEYVSHHWSESDFDLWEEVQGQHFYTRSVQNYFLQKGATLANKLDDAAAAQWYLSQQEKIAASLNDHWDNQNGYIRSTVKRSGGMSYKNSGLDSSVILAVLHTNNESSIFGLADKRIIATFFKLEEVFKSIYFINHEPISKPGWPELGVAIGRYPEDTFYGGNPWYLLTSAFAEFCYRQALLINSDAITSYDQKLHKLLMRKLKINLAPRTSKDLNFTSYQKQQLISAWKTKGDQFLARVLFHLGSTGHMPEQMNKNTGAEMSAKDLSWSYAAYLSAVNWRDQLVAVYSNQSSNARNPNFQHQTQRENQGPFQSKRVIKN